MFGEGSETCVPVSGKPKRPAVRPSVDCRTYGHESGWRQGLGCPGVTGVPRGQKQTSGPEFVMSTSRLKGNYGESPRADDGGLEAKPRGDVFTDVTAWLNSYFGLARSKRIDVIGDGDLPQQHAPYDVRRLEMFCVDRRRAGRAGRQLSGEFAVVEFHAYDKGNGLDGLGQNSRA